MVKKGIKITADPNLVNFHFTSTPQATSASTTAHSHHHHHHHHNHGFGSASSASSITGNAGTTRPRSGSFNSNKHHNHPKKNFHHQQHRTAEDRASSRKKISTHMFPLHSSPDHAFVLSRCCSINHQQHQHQQSSSSKNSEINGSSNNNMNTNYTFQGPDRPVAWESVRIVKCFTPITNSPGDFNGKDYLNDIDGLVPVAYIPCPICLDDNCISPRITKCGHTFCYTCILHHIQTYNDKTTNPKCPCCSLPIYMNDLRPIQIIPVQAPQTSIVSSKHSSNNTETKASTSMRFRKLHRYKYCHTSYIPDPTEPRRLSPNAIPCHTIDNDAIYAKFNYLHVPAYEQILQTNLNDLLSSLEQQQSYGRRSVSMMEEMVYGLAIQCIQTQLNYSVTNSKNMDGTSQSHQYQQELQLQQQYSNVGSGFYSLQIPSLIYQKKNHCSSEMKDRQNNNYSTATMNASTSVQPVDDTLQSTLTTWDYNGDDNPNDIDHNDHHRNHHYQHQQQQLHQRDRGNSITSAHSCNSSNSMNPQSNSVDIVVKEANGGSMYASDEEYILYQSCDGSLCFLSGFNMNCLRTEFAPTLPIINNNNTDCNMEQLSLNQVWDNDGYVDGTANQHSPTIANQHQHNPLTKPPLPDIVEGEIIDVERVLVSPEMRERRRFLSHIPLYTEVCFIEIDINHLLSSRTKSVYRKEFMKRKQSRLAREKAEQREDELLKQIEQEKIDERKARLQRIDPMDDFFQPVVPVHDGTLEPNMLSEDFGPSISLSTAATISAVSNDAAGATTLPGISFSQACQSGEIFPTLFSAPTEMNFPVLGSSPPNQKANLARKKVPPPSKPWGTSSATSTTSTSTVVHDDAIATPSSEKGIDKPPANGKKNRNKKIVLFSTGAQRNDYY